MRRTRPRAGFVLYGVGERGGAAADLLLVTERYEDVWHDPKLLEADVDNCDMSNSRCIRRCYRSQREGPLFEWSGRLNVPTSSTANVASWPTPAFLEQCRTTWRGASQSFRARARQATLISAIGGLRGALGSGSIHANSPIQTNVRDCMVICINRQ